jgi:hypothetical protein
MGLQGPMQAYRTGVVMRLSAARSVVQLRQDARSKDRYWWLRIGSVVSGRWRKGWPMRREAGSRCTRRAARSAA